MSKFGFRSKIWPAIFVVVALLLNVVMIIKIINKPKPAFRIKSNGTWYKGVGSYTELGGCVTFVHFDMGDKQTIRACGNYLIEKNDKLN